MSSDIIKRREYKIKNNNVFFCFNINGERRELFSLNFNNKRELFYIFPTDPTEKIERYHNDNWEIQRNDDHISFHRDGEIHTTFKHENRKKKGYFINSQNEKNVFEIEPNSVFPIMVHSFQIETYFKEIDLLDKTKKAKMKEVFNDTLPIVDFDKNTFTWDIQNPCDFSILIFGLGEKLDPKTLPYNHPLSVLMDKKYLHPVLLPWTTPDSHYDDVKLWIIISSKTLNSEFMPVIPKSNGLMSNYLHSYVAVPKWKTIETMK